MENPIRTGGCAEKRRRRGAGLAIAACLLVLAGVAVPGSAIAATVTLAPVSGQPVTLDLDQLPVPPDVEGRNYTVRSEAGDTPLTISGYSLAAMIEAAGLDPVTIGYLEVARPSGGTMLLSRRQATADGAFPDGPPVIFRDSQGLHILRPSSGPGDFNAADLISVGVDGALSLVARSGTLLKVSAKASVRKARVGQKVSFTATLDRFAGGEEVTVSWYFDDGGSAKGSEVSHSFRQPGLYDIVVGVTTPGDRVGASATVTVQVGEPKKQGPKRRGGGDNRDKNAPDSGASNGGSGPESGGPPAADPGPSSPAPSYSPAPATTTEPPPISQPQPEPQPQPKPRRPERQPAKDPVSEPLGDEIRGELLTQEEIETQPLAAIETAEDEQAAQPPAARTGSLSPEGGGGIPGALAGAGVALLMLGLGGILEARGVGRLRW